MLILPRSCQPGFFRFIVSKNKGALAPESAKPREVAQTLARPEQHKSTLHKREAGSRGLANWVQDFETNWDLQSLRLSQSASGSERGATV